MSKSVVYFDCSNTQPHTHGSLADHDLSLSCVAEPLSEATREKAKDAEIVPTETIRDAKISENAGTNLLEIAVLMKDGTLQTIHAFDPNLETWRQYQFSGLTLAQAQTLIESQNGASQIQ